MISIRRAQREDADAIADLFTATRKACMDYLPPLHIPQEDRNFIATVVMSRGEAWVADDAGKIAGFVAIHEDLVEHLYVSVAYQRRGIGTALLNKAKELRPGGFSLWVFQINRAAIEFYVSRGLSICKETNGEGNEERLPDALYRWAGLQDIHGAVDALRSGQLIAFPTETVYGLGADATSDDAVRRIFAVKGRPATNPLIVHIADIEIAKRYTTNWSAAAQTLAATYWPGPLTIVLPKTPDISGLTTAGLGTVGLRAPDHPLALALLRALDGPVAAPSANRSTHVSPTTAQHVRDEFGDAVKTILDGGPCVVGIESTVLDLSGNVPRILRPGAVTRKQIEFILGPVEMNSAVAEASVPTTSPGQHAIHYAPRTPAFRFETSRRGTIQTNAPDGRANGLVAVGTGRDEVYKWGPIVAMPREPGLYARHLYEVLRELDSMGLAGIFIEMPPDAPEWAAVRDRLLRATQPM